VVTVVGLSVGAWLTAFVARRRAVARTFTDDKKIITAGRAACPESFYPPLPDGSAVSGVRLPRGADMTLFSRPLPLAGLDLTDWRNVTEPNGRSRGSE
jgi:hypothetical protein